MSATARDEHGGNEVTLVGRVGGEGAQLLGATLEAADKRQTRDRGAGFSLVLDNGDHVTVDAKATAIVTPPRTREHKEWRELAASPLGALFDDVAPGDHVEVELTGTIISAGDRVAVRGAVGEVELVGGGPRESPDARPQRVVARAIAIVDGDDAAAIALLDREDARANVTKARAEQRRESAKPAPAKVPPPPRPWRIAAPVFLVIGGGVLVLALLLWSRTLSPFVVAIGALFATFGLAMQISLPPFDAVVATSRARFKPAWLIGGWCASAFAMHAIVTIVAAVVASAGASGAAAAALVTGAGFGLGLLAIVVSRQRRALRLARLLLQAPTQPLPLGDGTWGRFAGKLASPGVGMSRVVSYEYCVYYKRPGQADDVWKLEGVPKDQIHAKTVQVRSGDQTVTLSGELFWGAPLAYQRGDKLVVLATHAAISHEDSVVVLSRLRREGDELVARGTGPESLVMFGARGDDALATLRSLVRTWFARAALLGLLIVAQLALTAWLVYG